MQRPWGRAVPEETGVWLEHSKPRRRGKKRGHGGDGVGLAESCGLQEDLKSWSQGSGSPGRLGAEEGAGHDSSAHGRPLAALEN